MTAFSASVGHRLRTGALAFCALLGSACTHLGGATVSPVEGRAVEHLASRQPGPVVVFENGLGGTLDWWSKVWPSVAADTAAWAYNRAGYGKSAPTGTPRTGANVVQELRQALRSQGMSPPYVLVGHSLGGLYMQLYARQHPDEVAALILVDSTHPEQLRGRGDPSQWPTWMRVAMTWLSSEVAKQELAHLDATGQQVLTLAPPAGKPVIVLSALKPMGDRSPLADDSNDKRATLATLYPGAKQVWVDSGHAIPQEAPEAVVSAIREALAALKTQP